MAEDDLTQIEKDTLCVVALVNGETVMEGLSDAETKALWERFDAYPDHELLAAKAHLADLGLVTLPLSS